MPIQMKIGMQMLYLLDATASLGPGVSKPCICQKNHLYLKGFVFTFKIYNFVLNSTYFICMQHSWYYIFQVLMNVKYLWILSTYECYLLYLLYMLHSIFVHKYIKYEHAEWLCM